MYLNTCIISLLKMNPLFKKKVLESVEKDYSCNVPIDVLYLIFSNIKPKDWHNTLMTCKLFYRIGILRFNHQLNNNSVLIKSCKSGNYRLVCELLNSKNNTVDPSSDNNFPIIVSSWYGHESIVEFLLQDKRVNPAEDSNSAIILASMSGHDKVVALLLNIAKVNPADERNAALREASKNGHIQVVELLLQDARVGPDYYDKLAVKMAKDNNHTEIVQLLTNNKLKK